MAAEARFEEWSRKTCNSEGRQTTAQKVARVLNFTEIDAWPMSSNVTETVVLRQRPDTSCTRQKLLYPRGVGHIRIKITNPCARDLPAKLPIIPAPKLAADKNISFAIVLHRHFGKKERETYACDDKKRS